MKNDRIAYDIEKIDPIDGLEIVDKSIEKIISLNRLSRKQLNKLTFECVGALTEVNYLQDTLDNKPFMMRILGDVLGTNKEVQYDINRQQSIVQYASQQILNILSEQNLLTYDLLIAVNNKLNASLRSIDDEFNAVYAGLDRFLKYTEDNLLKLSARLDKVERNINLLNWAETIRHNQFEGVEYKELDLISLMICLARDFYEITKGEWSTTELMLLKSILERLDIQTDFKINYYEVVREIYSRPNILTYFLHNNGHIIDSLSPSDSMTSQVLTKLNSLENNESYFLHAFVELSGNANSAEVRDIIVKHYMKDHIRINIDIDVSYYDLLIELLYFLSDNCELDDNDLILGYKSINNCEKPDTVFEIYDNTYGYSEQVKVCDSITAAWFKKALDNGDIRAAQALGILYFWGEDLDQDYALAYKYLRPAAEAGLAAAQYYIGQMYYQGYYVNKNFSKAARWFKAAAERHIRDAEFVLATMYATGCGVDIDYKNAIYWFKRAFQEGEVLAAYDLGKLCILENSDYKNLLEAAYWFKQAAQNGDANSMYLLGQMYDKGEILSKNSKEALKLYKESADLGNNKAKFSLGTFYEIGRCVNKDINLAIRFYRDAAEGGNADAQFKLGYLYENGNSLERDLEKAIQWYKRAAEQDSGQAQCALGAIYSDDLEDTFYNLESGVCWLKKAISNGIAPAVGELAELLHDRKIKVTNDEVNEWFNLGVKTGNVELLEELKGIVGLMSWPFEDTVQIDLSYSDIVEEINLIRNGSKDSFFNVNSFNISPDNLGDNRSVYLPRTGNILGKLFKPFK